jgi:transposase
MMGLPSGVRVWLAAGHTDMRRGMQGLALQVQEGLRRDPHAGDLKGFDAKLKAMSRGRRKLKLPRFRGHRNICVQGVHDGQNETTLHT